MRISKFLFLVPLCIFFNSPALASFSLTLDCQDYPSPFISDWENNPGIVNITITYTGATPDTVRLESRGVSAERGEIASGQSANIIFTGPQTVRRDNRDFWDYRNITYNEAYREQIVRAGRLLEGTYTLYVNLVKVSTGAILDERSATFYILSFSPPSLIAPANRDTVRVQFPTFQWTQATAHPGFTVRYHLKICEMRSGQTPEVAINNIAHHQEVIINATNFTYPSSARPFEENKNYVWQVQAKDRNDIPIGENEGKSEIFVFVFKTTAPPTFQISNLRFTVPATIAVNETVRAKLRFDVRGSGTVRGRFLIDNAPFDTFNRSTATSPDSLFSANLPTDSTKIGRHKLKVEITHPVSLFDSANYEITSRAFRIDSLRLTLPRTIPVLATIRAKVKFYATGRGDVRGRFLIDDNPWRVFSQYTETSPDSFFSLSLPTDSQNIGRHKLKVEITEPTSLQDSADYEITSEAVRLDSLLLVSGVAYIKNISEPLIPDGSGNRYRISGTATMRLLSLDNREVPECTLRTLKIILNPTDPFNSTVDTGLVQKSSGVDTSLFGYKDNFLKITRVQFEKRGSPVDFISINAKLNIPRINITLYEVNDLIVKRTGIEGKGFSTTQEFSRWGVTFSLRDIATNRAITLGKTGDTLWASLCGDIKLSRNNTQHTLTRFTNFKVTDGGKITGQFDFADPFRLIPNNSYIKLTRCSFFDSLSRYYLKFDGRIESLPKPIDTILRRTDFSFLLDMDGNTVGKISPLNELSPDQRGASNDISEFRIPVIGCTLDLTYLGVTLTIVNGDLKLNQSKIEMAMDIYFPFKDDADRLLPVAERRLAIGEMRLGQLEGGITIDFNGNLSWNLPPSIPVIRNKRLNLGDVIRFTLQQLAIEPTPFAFVLNCSLGINISGVGGGAMVNGLKIRTNGDIEYPIIMGGSFKILEVFNVTVGMIRWSNRDTALSFDANQTPSPDTGNFRSGRQTINLSGYFLMENAGINIGTGGGIASGRFSKLLVYKPSGGGSKKVTLTGANLTIAGMQLLADYDYSNPSSNLRFAGTLNIPSGIGVTAVGKIGNRGGNPSFGLFVAARGLQIPVGPGVTLTDVGGGFFWYPEEVDISTVRRHCGFTRPEMTNKFTEKRPRADDPGAFALLFYGGVTFLGTDAFVTGRALLTLTTRRFDLDAEAKVMKMADPAMDARGTLYLSIGWNPAYAEGAVRVDVSVIELITGDGRFEFYVYSADAWGIMGETRLSVIRLVSSETNFFVGNPGFLLEVKFGYGIDIYVLSGSIRFNGMVWYKTIVPRSWGGYAGVRASADILGGLAGASFGLEGALIGEPEYLIYCVGSLSVEVCWVEVFSGSIWVSIGKNGFDGGTGRNSRYDQLIEDARNMAGQMQEERDRVRDAMADAQATMFALSEEQRQRAGMALVEASGARHFVHHLLYLLAEVDLINSSALVKTQSDTIFDAVARDLAKMRDTLRAKENRTRDFISSVDTTRARVDARLAGYRAILEERLPTVREIGLLGSPFQGKTHQTITVSGPDTSFTVTCTVGYNINYAQADAQKRTVNDVKTDNDHYRQELLRIAGIIDQKLLKLDSLLFMPTPGQRNDMSGLCSLYQEGYRKIIDYYWYLGDYIGKNQTNAARKISFLNRRISFPWPIGTVTCSSAIKRELEIFAAGWNWQRLRRWIEARQSLIRILDTLIPAREIPLPANDQDTAKIRELRNMWISYGMELWYHIPKAGYQGIITFAPTRWDTLKAVYRKSTGTFSTSWVDFTSSLDRVYSRKAEFYELLYDLYDQLELMGDVPTATPRRTVEIAGRRYSMLARTINFSPLSRSKEFLAQLLTPPRITSFSGEYRSDATTPSSFGRVSLNWTATHSVRVVDYSFWLRREGTGMYFLPSPKTLGLSRNFWLPFIYPINEPGDYGIFLRARGAGGYPITQKGVVKVAYYGPDVPPQRNTMRTLDTTPPTRPVITTDTIISSIGQVYAKWYAGDGESGIEEYQYTFGKEFYSPPLRAYVYTPIVDWTSSGGRTEVNIRNLNLRHNETYTLKVKAKNGVGLWSDAAKKSIKVDTSEPTKPRITGFVHIQSPNPYTLVARWQRSEDTESGILKYVLSISRRPFGTDIVDTTTISRTSTSFSAISSKSLKNGDTLFLTLRAFNNSRLPTVEPMTMASVDTSSVIVRFFDNTPPLLFNVSFTKNFSYAVYPPALVSITFTRDSTYDNESGIFAYHYRLEDVGGNYIINWTAMSGRSVTLTASQLAALLTRGRNYVLKVEAVNGAELRTIAQVSFVY